MVDSPNGPTSFWAQANAFLRKNLTFQKRHIKTNIRLILFPIILCLLLVVLQKLIDRQLNKAENKCGPEYSDSGQAGICAITHPPEWPPLMQVPSPKFRAVKTDILPYPDLPNESCRSTGSCPVTMLITGNNQSFGEILAKNMLPSNVTVNDSDIFGILARNVLGSESAPYAYDDNFLELGSPIYYLQSQKCIQNASFSVPIEIFNTSQRVLNASQQIEVRCAQGLNLWRNSSFEVNNELYKGYHRGNNESQVNEIAAAYDFLNSNRSVFNVSIWYNKTYENALARVPRSVNLASNAYLQYLLGEGSKMIFEFVKEMPSREFSFMFDLASVLGPLFFTWVILQLFPVVLTSLLYEKQQKLRIMMKMHGLGDGPYWLISYGYFLAISVIYMLCFVIFGSVIGLKFFKLNDYSIQFTFYFIYINLQISSAFLVAAMFSNLKAATVIAYIVIFGTGLLGRLFQFVIEDTSFPRGWVIVMELYPGFALYRGLYEFAESSTSVSQGTGGMRWRDLSDSTNGMREVLIIMIVEWVVVLFVAYYIDKVLSSRSGKSPLFFLKGFQKKPPSSFQRPGIQRQGPKVCVQIDKHDVMQEREKVEQLLLEPTIDYTVVCDDLKKRYPGRDGNADKLAVRGLSLALPQGECFGMLGPNGAGKTSFINMMIGLTKPTSGTAFVQGLDIRTHMDEVYTSMGVCPQHNLLWETLTGREHLLFYGRLKNLKGSALIQAVEESLRNVNLFYGGVADKQAGKYSGGMKRRLSVAISLIGNPRVVYMDEPSTGLDPASRNNLWSVIKRAKQDCAIILTTHSMEEAEVLCDRIGIFVDGSLQCIGNPKQLKAKYGGSYVFTMTTSSDHENDVENLVRQLSPNSTRVYHISGTQKFEMPKAEVRIADVFRAVDVAKSNFTVFAWGLVDTTLEDVFIKVASEAQPCNVLS